MAITKQVIRQRDWSAGQLDPEAFRRDDLKLYKQAAREVTNLRPLPTGSLTRRPGRSILYFDGGRHDIVRPFADVTFDVTFAANRFTARLRSGAIVSDLSAPWTADMLAELSWVPYGHRIYVCHKELQPRVLEYDRDAGTWALSTYTFRTELDGTLGVPFYRFANFGVTIQPSALSGSVTLTASAAVFVAGHVGLTFEYGGRQLTITAVTDSTHATATTLQDLPPVWRVTVGSTEGFVVGEIVQGDTSNAEGEIVQINAGSGYLYIFTTKNWGSGSTWSTSDTVVGAAASSKASAVSSSTPHAASVQWREQFMSNLRGWPGSVSQGFARLCFCDFDQLENAILWSAIDQPDNLKLGAKADQAMLETVPTICRVLHVAGTADLFVLTDKSVHYIPISAQNPLQPGAIEFRPLGTAGSAKVKPVEVGDGLVFIGATLPLVWAVTPTGTQTRPYEVKKLNGLAQSLFNDIVAVAASAGQSDTNPEQHLFVVNGDGSLVAGHGTLEGDLIGWFPWTGAGMVTDVAAREGDVIFTCQYTLDDGTVETVEGIDATKYLDGSVDLADYVGTDPITDSSGDPLLDSTGDAIAAAGGALVPFASETLQAWDASGRYLGDIAVDEHGRVAISGVNLSTVTIGWNFTPTLVPFLETFEGGDDIGQRLRRRKVAKAVVTVKASTSFRVNRRVVNSYRTGEDWGAAPPARSGSFPGRTIGRAYDPTVTIDQPTPGPFTLVEFNAEVTA